MERTRRSRNFLPLHVMAVILLAISAFALFFHSCRGDGGKGAVEVQVIEAVPGQTVIYGDYEGRIRAQEFVEVHARVEGYLDKILFREGSYIKRGQPMFVIDPKIYYALANKAKAMLKKAEAQERKAKHDLDRITPLYAQNAASQLELDNALAAYESAQAEVTVSEADLLQAEMTLEYTRINAPISGFVQQRLADIGTFVGPSGGKSLLATIEKTDTVLIDFNMPSSTYLVWLDCNRCPENPDSLLRCESEATIILPNGTVWPFRGVVDFTNPQVDPKTGVFSLSAAVANPDNRLLTGEPARVKLELDTRKDAITLPRKVMKKDDNGSFVLVVGKDNRAEKRYISTVDDSEGKVVVESGLEPDASVIVSSSVPVEVGMKVKPVSQSASK